MIPNFSIEQSEIKSIRPNTRYGTKPRQICSASALLAMTQVEALAKYAARASFADLSAQSRQQLPVHILDSLGCCIAALGAGPVEACRAQVADFGGDGPCALIGGGNANPIFAAFWHTALVRYVDFMDNFLAPTETEVAPMRGTTGQLS
jgi:hypothetical protein